jgi:uncharacterized iron-regulated membrane protein
MLHHPATHSDRTLVTRTFDTRFWRKWHRWIGFPAALFLLFAAVTGFIVAFTEFFGEEEALRERTRDLVSPVTVTSPQSAWSDPVARAIATAAATVPGAPIDRITMRFKGDQQTVSVYTGKPGGGEDRQLVMDARTGALLENKGYKDKPFLTRLHSGEAFGDGGLVLAMFWALALAIMAASGIIIYYTMRGKRELTGIHKVFW